MISMEPSVSAGNILKQAREGKGLSLEGVSKSTKISVHVLAALEADELFKLPSGMYARAFIKTYAEFLGVAAVAMKQHEKSNHPAVPALPILRPDESLTPSAKRRQAGLRKPWILGLLGASFAVVLVVRLVTGFSHPPTKKGPIDLRPQAQKIANAAVATAPVVIAPAPHVPAKPVVASVREGLSLDIVAMDKVWVRVKADNLLLFEGTLSKNDRESWTAKREFLIRVGSAGAVKIFLNDEELGKVGNKGEVKTVVINKDGIVKTR